MADRLRARRMVSIREFSRRLSVVSELRLPCKFMACSVGAKPHLIIFTLWQGEIILLCLWSILSLLHRVMHRCFRWVERRLERLLETRFKETGNTHELF